jgi:hypothetical protein
MVDLCGKSDALSTSCVRSKGCVSNCCMDLWMINFLVWDDHCKIVCPSDQLEKDLRESFAMVSKANVLPFFFQLLL